jgi:hypothetical protein
MRSIQAGCSIWIWIAFGLSHAGTLLYEPLLRVMSYRYGTLSGADLSGMNWKLTVGSLLMILRIATCSGNVSISVCLFDDVRDDVRYRVSALVRIQIK